MLGEGGFVYQKGNGGLDLVDINLKLLVIKVRREM